MDQVERRKNMEAAEFKVQPHLALNNSSVMHSFVDSFFEEKKALVKERLMDSVRVIVDGLFEEMVGHVKEMMMPPFQESAGTTPAEPSTPKSPVSTSTVPPSQEHQQHQEEEENQQQHQDGRRRSPSPSALEPPAKVPRLIEKPAVGGRDEPTVVEDEPAVEPGLVAPPPGDPRRLPRMRGPLLGQ
ncbi:hypothetical protein TYRP_020408 [Tyrophagus putrescentiae]|nr:hypothetical protein TYRP_020408 [Tyrophagus putrescentiae]